jgi:tRNA (guanine-N7-)-methyltransferase
MPRVRHHVNPLKASYASAASTRVPLPADGEVEVELGCADARFLFERAAADRALTCIGVEIREDFIGEVNMQARTADLPNLRAVFGNVNTDLDTLFPDERLARVFLNFPDPWFKRRHHKRRVLTPELAGLLHCKMAPGGVLFFQSDVFDLALDAMAVLEQSDRFDNQHGAWSFAPSNPWGARSLREVRCLERDLRIWRLSYLRR